MRQNQSGVTNVVSWRVFAAFVLMMLLAKAHGGPLEQVLGRDLSPNAKDDNGWTDLHYAAVGDFVVDARLLLDAGANVNAQIPDDQENYTAELVNRLNKISTVGNWKNWYRFGEMPLHFAAFTNAEKVTTLLLNNGADAEAKNSIEEEEETPLHFAAWGNADNVAELLLKYGVDFEARNVRGSTPLHVAAHVNADKVAVLLLKSGAAVGAKNYDGNTPLHYAARKNAEKVLALLLESGAYAEKANNNGETPLDWALEAGYDHLRAILEQE